MQIDPELGQRLRREGLYSNQLKQWRESFAAHGIDGLSKSAPGPSAKYTPEQREIENWPSSGFLSVEGARDWVHHFVDWYNHEHKHSQINYVTPAERHQGLDEEILSARKAVLEAARQANPRRWTGSVRNCEPVGAVMLNPDDDKEELLKRVG